MNDTSQSTAVGSPLLEKVWWSNPAWVSASIAPAVKTQLAESRNSLIASERGAIACARVHMQDAAMQKGKNQDIPNQANERLTCVGVGAGQELASA